MHCVVPESGNDYERHLHGSSALVVSALRHPVSGSALQQAAFWGHFRQCLYVACVHRQPLKFDISSYEIEMTLSTPSTGVMATVEEEGNWCKWITWILAEVCEFCFGATRPASATEARSSWSSLLTKVEMWDANKPKSFLPLSVVERDPEKGQWFPELCYGSGWHSLANMYHLTAHILLDVYDPMIRNISIGEFGSLRARLQLETKVLAQARTVCGICFANQHIIPTVVALCQAVFAFSSFLSEPEERKLLIEILRRGERESAWSTTWIVNALMEDWDCEET
ncbi:hypothetical protein LTR07_006582 [Exophiala xenobiotica]|nr:hypothetical protein LTS06_009216 [Exophiala xenobiotica]KAK5394825.1 hypothetical protein LTR79_007441 [Exophiala xenobiotica]KAK5491335.1 hypothetical protein LTR83_006176 [Exophiala xenobiotica]KAK5516800.1 hypothetical protein LTR07_006582 [Exophiala xenobiotica]